MFFKSIKKETDISKEERPSNKDLTGTDFDIFSEAFGFGNDGDEDIDPSSESETVPTPAPTASDDDEGKVLNDLVKNIEEMNAAVLQRVSNLEDLVMKRSQEIKEESAGAFDRVIERTNKLHELAIKRARDIKQAMYEAELKDLELQKVQLNILNDCEDQAIEREKKMQSIFDFSIER